MKIDKNDRIAYWLAIDIANQAGKDKLSFDNRVKFVEDNYEHFDDIQEFADSPYELLNSLRALDSHLNGEEVNHYVYLDASNQALQLYSVLTADKKTASTCNIANGDNMADAYQLLADALNKAIPTMFFTRADCKKALMTTMYGKADGSIEIIQHMIKTNQSTNDKVVAFGNQYGFQVGEHQNGSLFLPELKQLFQESMVDIAPKAVITMEALTGLNETLELATYYWTLPDGFKVKYDVKKEIKVPSQQFVSKKGLKITLPPMKVTKYMKDEASRGMSPNVIHSVDGYIVREMVRRMNGKFITTIHDAFACHPRDCDTMINNYKDILCELLDSELLSDIASQIGSTKMTMTKTNDLTCEDIRNSTYLLG